MRWLEHELRLLASADFLFVVKSTPPLTTLLLLLTPLHEFNQFNQFNVNLSVGTIKTFSTFQSHNCVVCMYVPVCCHRRLAASLGLIGWVHRGQQEMNG